jgi:TrpR family trp operon transcriptional repressor
VAELLELSLDISFCNGVTLQPYMEKDWHDFLKLCSKLKSEKDLENLFNLFFTLEEKEVLASRFEIIKKLLEEKLTQREIAETCKVSISQITRGSNALKIIDPKFKTSLISLFRWWR